MSVFTTIKYKISRLDRGTLRNILEILLVKKWVLLNFLISKPLSMPVRILAAHNQGSPKRVVFFHPWEGVEQKKGGALNFDFLHLFILFFTFLMREASYNRVCPSVRLSVRHTFLQMTSSCISSRII